jgi:hypothetical protein
MKEILEFRTQIFTPKLPEKIVSFSGIEILNFHEEDIELPQLLLVYELISEEIFEKELVSKLIKDVFHDHFFKKESLSNQQIAEEAILDVKHKLIKILKTSDKNRLDFNVICGIFYENNLSIVKYGKIYASLVRDGEFKDLEFATEGYFGSIKGVVKSSDVLIFATQNFYKKFINQDLLNNGLKVDDDSLDPNSSSLIFMFYKSPEQKKKEVLQRKSKKVWLRGSRFLKKNFYKIIFVGIILSIYFGITSYLTYQDNLQKQELSKVILETENVLSKEYNQTEVPSYSEEILTQINKLNAFTNIPSKDEYISKLKNRFNEVNNIKEVSYEVLYDFKETNPRISLNSFVLLNDNIYILDTDTSKIYYSKFSDLKFENYEVKIANLKHLDYFSKTLALFDENNVYLYTQDLNKENQDIKIEGLGTSRMYMNFIYEIKDNKINRIDLNDDSPQRVLWAENSAITDAKDINIDFDIYLLDKNSKLLRFSRGVLQNTNFENDRYNFSKLFISSSLKNNYFISENKIFEYSKDGKLLNIYSDPTFNEKINDFIVLKDRVIFVSNSKLVSLKL